MWTGQIDSKTFTYLKHGFSGKLKTKYPDLHFTASERGLNDAVFPTVYIHPLQGTEDATTLSGTDIPAAVFNYQIDVFDNLSNHTTSVIADECVRVMKALGYKTVGMPVCEDNGITYRHTMRFRRTIASGDNY